MNELNSLYSLLDKLGILDDFYKTYGPYFLKAALIFALLNCFFGYKLRKVWSCIFGLLLGVGTGLAAAVYLGQPVSIALAAGAAGGIIFTALAFLLYRIGMFFLCIGVVIMTLFQLFPTPTFSTICGFVVFGVVMGFLAVIKEHNVVICITAVCGGIGSARLIMILAGMKSPVLLVLTAIVLTALGLVFQFKPWKDKDYWKKEEDKSSEKHKKQKSRRSASKSKSKKRSSKSSSAKKKSASRSSNSRPASSNKGSQTKKASGRNPNDQIPSDNPDIRNQNVTAPQTSSVPQDRGNIGSNKGQGNFKHGDRDSDSYTVDLSDIRTEISKEIQDIYHDKHN